MFCRFVQTFALAAPALLLLVVAIPGWAGPIPVYSQAADFQNVWASQNDTSSGGFGNYATTYDNFSLASATKIVSAGWAGGYFSPQSAGPITAWTVTFWADSAGQPGGQLASFVIAGNGGETFLQNDVLGDPIYSYSAAVNFNAVAGVMYWLSVVPDIAYPPQWGWTTSSQGDGVSYEDFFGTRYLDANDQAFSLFANTVPEPGSFILLGTGVVGIAGAVRRKLML